MTFTKTAYRNYLFDQIDDSERLAVEHRMYKPNFVQKFGQVLDEYKLAEQIKAAQAGKRSRVKILDVGCGEGLYLHDVAYELETRGLLDGTTLYGFDIDANAIETALQFSKVSKPPRPYLNFFWQDLTNPLDENLFGQTKFDFIYAHITLTFLPNARQNLETLYNLLAPGGVIFLRDLVLHEGEGGWNMAESAAALRPFCRGLNSMIGAVNGGQDVSLKYGEWLRELKANLVQTELDVLPVGGETKGGMDSLRAAVMTLRNMKQLLIATGAMTESQIDELMTIIYREANANWVGSGSYMNTLGQKPA